MTAHATSAPPAFREDPHRGEAARDEPDARRGLDVVVSRDPSDAPVVVAPRRALVLRQEVEPQVAERQRVGRSHAVARLAKSGRLDETRRREDRGGEDRQRDRAGGGESDESARRAFPRSRAARKRK